MAELTPAADQGAASPGPVARAEAAWRRAGELQQRRSELASGLPSDTGTAERARQHAEESLQRAKRAHRAAAARHLDASAAHRRAAAAHEQAAILAGNGSGEAHQDAAARHRAAAEVHEAAAVGQAEAGRATAS
jgi:hypothetical protein